jgi:hypothetical protein
MASARRELGIPSPPSDPSPASFGDPAPYSVFDAVRQGVVEARFLDRAVRADALGDLDTDAVAGKKGLGGVLSALALGHPGGVHSMYLRRSSASKLG